MKYAKRSTHHIFVGDNDCYLNLQIAIINQAMADWRSGDRRQKAKIEKFLLSDWGQALSNDMGEIIIEKLRKGA
jgi:hypothetical protein